MIDELLGFLSGPPIVWAPRLTALFLIASRPWRQHESSGSLASLFGKLYLAALLGGLLLNDVAMSPWFWLSITSLHFLWIFSAYPTADNHRYLEGYWCMAIGIALWTGGTHGSQDLSLNARLLIGLCFFFATLWKSLSASFRNGSFFVERLLFEKRFLPIALWAGGLSPKVQIQHLEARRKLLIGSSRIEKATVPRRLLRTGQALAWWTIGIESLIAGLFLIPFPDPDLWRVLALGLFVLTTYFLIPVPTFGQILLLMTSVTLEDVRLRIIALGLMLLIGPITGLAHLMERIAKRKIGRQLRNSSPQFHWGPRANSWRITQDGSSARLLFPKAGISLYIQSSWASALEGLLALEYPFTQERITKTLDRMPGAEAEELIENLFRLRILQRIPVSGILKK
ncbi:hypothetical protein F9K50_07095 [bacterium]|nr:MAG: hypothetical protein F9K50_07095 [bacterium]